MKISHILKNYHVTLSFIYFVIVRFGIKTLFKSAICKMLLPANPPAFYDLGERLPAIWHTQMRLEHSTLNHCSHLYGFTDTPLCTCGAVENNGHYFLDCPKYAALRTVLLKSIAGIVSPGVNSSLLLHLDKQYLLKLILYGSSDLSFHENELLFQSVQLYIKDSNRFDNIFRF